MSQWQFSESSEPLLRRCMELAAVKNTGNKNKWIEKFGSKSGYLSKNDEISIVNTVIPLNNDNGNLQNTIISVEDSMDIDENPIFVPVPIKVEKDDLCRGILDLEPIANFDYILEKCLENSNLYLFLANELPVASIEKLCKHIYDTRDIDTTFLEKFYLVFFPTYLKREPTRSSLDLLIRLKCHLPFHKQLIVMIVKDFELPTNVLHDFVSTLNMIEKTEFLKTLSLHNIAKEAFVHHLATIHEAYKDSLKSAELQNYILTQLQQLSENCTLDKNYGRFLLSFLQSHRDYGTNISEIENTVSLHKSAFMRPCLNILNEIKNQSRW